MKLPQQLPPGVTHKDVDLFKETREKAAAATAALLAVPVTDPNQVILSPSQAMAAQGRYVEINGRLHYLFIGSTLILT